MVAVLTEKLWFPPASQADADGMVAIGGDLSPERLLLAYRSGIFPWTCNPLTWWSPHPRGIFELDAFHVSRSFGRTLRKKTFEISYDRAFRKVMEACAAPAAQRAETWIADSFIEAYTRLHQLGHAHSVECWVGGNLAGGIYGVQIGGFFAGESMFHRVDDGSKAALYFLVQRLREKGFGLFDIQMLTPITEQLGGTWTDRESYLSRLCAALKLPRTF